jgi:hypothetical protein
MSQRFDSVSRSLFVQAALFKAALFSAAAEEADQYDWVDAPEKACDEEPKTTVINVLFSDCE